MTEKQHSALSGTELHDPKSHASTHITSDAIQSATNAVNGLATSSHITAIEANTAKVTNATHTGDVTGATGLTIGADKVLDSHINWGTEATQVGAADVPIADAGAKITATEVEGALQENRTAIDLNTAKVTNADHTGEVTGATALTIATDAVTYDKMQDTSGTDKILGRSTAGAGTIEEIVCTAAGRAILDDANVSAQRTTLNVDVAGTDNSTDVTLDGTPTYITIAGQVITRNPIDDGELTSGATVASAGAGDSGKLVKLDAAGHVDATVINDGDISHLNIGSIGTNSHATIDTHLGAANPHSGSAASGSNSDITQLSGLTTDLSIAQGGTGESTAQAAINALSQVSGATNEHIFTKDTGTGNASWKVSSCSGVIFEESGNVVRERSDGGYDNDFVIGSPQLADDANPDHDARMWFDKSKGAFRAGRTAGTQWDDSNVGTNSFGEGNNPTASGSASHAEGGTTTASGSGAHAEGSLVTASGEASHAEGGSTIASGNSAHAEGYSTIAEGDVSHAEGEYANAYLFAQHARSSGRFAANGDAQLSNLIAQIETTDATANVEMFIDGTSIRAILPENRSWRFRIEIVARQTAGAAGTVGDSGMYTIEGGIKRDGANNTSLVGSIMNTTIAEDQAAWNVTAVADDTNEALVIKVTGEADKTIHWAASINLVEVG